MNHTIERTLKIMSEDGVPMFEVLTDAELERRTLQVAREYEDVLGPPTAADLDRWARLGRGEITIEEAEAEMDSDG